MFNILVCDDDKEIVDAIDIYLSQEGYHILKAYDGLQAIEIMKKEEVHLILLDIMMPNLDGIRATRKIRETSSVPIIMLSAKSEDVDKILGLNIGDVLVPDEDAAGVDVLQACEHAQGGRLPAAGGADEDEELAVGDLKIEGIHARAVIARVNARGVIESHSGHGWCPFTGRYVPDDP